MQAPSPQQGCDPWRGKNQSILKEINPEYSSLEGLMLKLKKLQCFGHWCEELTHWKRPWCWERLRAGREVGDRGLDGWMASPTQWAYVWANSRSWGRTEKAWGVAVPGVKKSRTRLGDWTTNTVIETKKWMLVQHYSLNYRTDSDFTCFSIDVIFLFQDTIQRTTLSFMIVALVSPSLGLFLSLCIFPLKTLTVLSNTGQIA